MNHEAFVGGLIGGLAGVGVFVLFTHVLALVKARQQEQAMQDAADGLGGFR